MNQIEKQFIQQINAKQMDAYRELFRMFYRYLVLYAMRYVQAQEPAEDIVQEVFIGLWKGNKTYNSFYGFRCFLYESVKNGCLNYVKHKRLEQEYVAYTLEREGEEQEELLNYKLMREEVYRRMYRVVEELPEGCRKVFEQHLAGKKNEEIAALLHISVETVKSQKKRGIRVLRERMGSLYVLAMLMWPFYVER